MTRYFSYFALLFMTLLSACSNLTQQKSPPKATKTLETATFPREYHHQITMSGRLSAQYEVNNKPQSIHIHFNWAQTTQQTVITLSSPTGQTLARLILNDHGAQLNRSNQPPLFANDANELALTSLGWPLPVAGLTYWLQGFIDADHHQQITPANVNDTFSVDGWTLRYVQWEVEKATGNNERPKRLDLTRQTDEAGLVSLRIAINEWNAP